MLTLLIALCAAAGVFFATRTGLSFGWSLTCSIGAFVLIQALGAVILHFRVKKINQDLQNIMLEARKKIELKQANFMRRPAGSPQQIMKTLERDQNQAFESALTVCEQFKPLYLWNFMLEKQINTIKMSFHYQLGNMDVVDKLLEKCLLLDPQAIAMRLARMYVNKDSRLDKFFKKKARSLRKENGVLPTLTYAWILVKQNRIDDAVKVLADAKAKCSNPVLVRNWEVLCNNKVRQFSNADLGEMWYALKLEEMKVPRVQQRYAHAR